MILFLFKKLKLNQSSIFFHLLLIFIYVNSEECPKRKIKDNTCTTECDDTEFEFGDYCYENCTNNGLTESEITIPHKKCKCDSQNGFKYIKEEKINGLSYYMCVKSCPYNFYEVGTNICVEKCKGTKNKITKDNGCADSCGLNQVLFVKTLTNGEKMNYCLDKCPDELKFYNPSPIHEIKCISKCDDKYFYKETSLGYECLSDCDNQAKIDLDSETFICTNNNKGPCTDLAFPYEFEGSCLKKCEDTKELEYFGKKDTYYFFSEEYNKFVCSENCEEKYITDSGEKTHNAYIVPNSFYCVDDCQKNSI